MSDLKRIEEKCESLQHSGVRSMDCPHCISSDVLKLARALEELRLALQRKVDILQGGMAGPTFTRADVETMLRDLPPIAERALREVGGEEGAIHEETCLLLRGGDCDC